MTGLYLVRHGETDGGEGRVVGHLDLPLSSAGALQARALAQSWRGPAPDRLISSDLRRARQTAAPLGERLGVPVVQEPRLRELHFGLWEGLAWDEVHRRFPAQLEAWGSRWWEVAPPQGESFQDLSKRALEWLEETRATEGVTLAVAHGGSLRALLARLLDLPRAELFDLQLDHGHVSVVVPEGDGFRALCLNRRTFPRP